MLKIVMSFVIPTLLTFNLDKFYGVVRCCYKTVLQNISNEQEDTRVTQRIKNNYTRRNDLSFEHIPNFNEINIVRVIMALYNCIT